jgi:tRNA 2-thiouridine synthesizing protein A
MEIQELDVRRLLCPIPVIRTQQATKKMNVGDQLKIIATDPGVMHDIPSWCRLFGHQIIETKEIENEYIILIQVGEP